jgi:hypothetical protein
MSVSLLPIFPAKAGTQIQPELVPFLTPPSLTIWAPAFAGEVGILCVGGQSK